MDTSAAKPADVVMSEAAPASAPKPNKTGGGKQKGGAPAAAASEAPAKKGKPVSNAEDNDTERRCTC